MNVACILKQQDERTHVCTVCGKTWTRRQGRPIPPPENVITPCRRSPRGACAFLGEQIGLRECESCRGHVRIKVFACSHPGHAETTREECEACPDFLPKKEIEEEVITAARVGLSMSELRRQLRTEGLRNASAFRIKHGIRAGYIPAPHRGETGFEFGPDDLEAVRRYLTEERS